MNNEANITQFLLQRCFYWLFPFVFFFFLWLFARFFFIDSMLGYAVQAIVLSAPPYLFLVFPFYTFICWWKHYRLWTMLSCLCWFGVGNFDVEGVGKATILVANVNAFSGHEESLGATLASFGTPYVIQIEQRITSIPGMKRVGYDAQNMNLRMSHYSDVYCLEECSATVTGQMGSSTMAMPVALLRIPDNICVVAIHAPPPLPVDATGMKPYLAYLAEHIAHGRIAKDWLSCQKNDKVVLMGDLNAVPNSFPYHFLLSMGLRDVRGSSGLWGTTWPMQDFYLPIPVFRLDHIFVGEGVEPKGWKTVSIPDSDHKGLLIWL